MFSKFPWSNSCGAGLLPANILPQIAIPRSILDKMRPILNLGLLTAFNKYDTAS